MKVVAYSYELDGHAHYLYVDSDFDEALFPPEIKMIISDRPKMACNESVIAKFGPRGEVLFRKNGFLDTCRYYTESEGPL